MKKPDFIKENESLARHCTLGVGGTADYFADIESYGSSSAIDSDVKLIEAVEFARDMALDIFILGRGSNVLFGDKGFRGLVVNMRGEHVGIIDGKIHAESGVLISDLVRGGYTCGYTGFENFAGLPGTVGGAIYGNAGCYGSEFWDVVENVTFFDGEYIQTLEKDKTKFRYRWSIFKNHPEWTILSASFLCELKGKKAVAAASRRARDQRQSSQPKERSCGCFFKNPIINGERVSAGKLIDEAGLKGFQAGQAMISPTHANFFVNLGGATAADFLKLIKIARTEVLQRFGVVLEEEIIKVGEF